MRHVIRFALYSIGFIDYGFLHTQNFLILLRTECGVHAIWWRGRVVKPVIF